MMHRVDTIVSVNTDKDKKRRHITEALTSNGYLNWLINNVQHPNPPTADLTTPNLTINDNSIPSVTQEEGETNTQPARKKKFPIVLPYIRGVSEQLRRTFKGYDVPAFFKPSNTIRQL